jgi:glycosyltransferase involved in cell wall biosynthesis
MSTGNTIVFINQNSGYLMIDIVNAHKQKYKNRVFLTGKILERNTSLDPDVKVDKIIAYNRTSSFKRIFTWIFGFLQILILVKTKYRNAELYIVSNPPLATLLPLFCKNKFYLLLFDVYPDVLVEYKILNEDSFFIRKWKQANKRIYCKAKKIFTISNGMKILIKQYVKEESIRVASVWTDNNFLTPIPKKENSFIVKHGWEDKFLVIYSGNMGHTHDLKVLVEVASKIRNNNIVFVIIGEGQKKKLLKELIADYQLKNCFLLPWQDISVFPYSLSAADLGVVSLGKEASLLSVPSKTYNLMSVGAPLLCIASQQSELANLIDHYQFGKCFDASEVKAIVAFVENLARNNKLHHAFKERALAASREFGPDNALKFLAR